MSQEHYQRAHGFSAIPVIHPALFFDDCSGTFTYVSAGTGADYVAEYDPLAAHVQTNGILLKTRETTPADADEVAIYRRLWLPPRGVLRLQLMFSLLSYAPTRYLDIVLTWNNNDVAHDAGLRVKGSNGICYYITGYAAGEFTWTAIPNWKAGIIDHAWNKIDLSVNLDTDFHHKIQLNEHVLDGRDIPVHTHDLVMEKHMHLYMRLRSGAAVQVTAYLDQILLTQESP